MRFCASPSCPAISQLQTSPSMSRRKIRRLVGSASKRRKSAAASDRSTRGRPSTFFDQDVVAHVSLALPTDAALSFCLGELAAREGASVHRAGTYLCMEGPQFSTRAESLLHRSLKADVIGMTNLPEAKLAREAELPYASLCFVTDYDAWHDSEDAVTVDAVLTVLRKNVNLAQRILRSVQEWPDPSASPASSALQGAILTDAAFIPPPVRERLAPLLGKYLPVSVP